MFFDVYTVWNLHHMCGERFSVVLRGNKIDIGMEQNGQLWRVFFPWYLNLLSPNTKTLHFDGLSLYRHAVAISISHCKSKETAIEYHQLAMVHCSKDFSVNKPYTATRVVLLLGHYRTFATKSLAWSQIRYSCLNFKLLYIEKVPKLQFFLFVGCWEEAISKLRVVFGVEPPLKSLLFTEVGTQWEKMKQDTLLNYLCKLYSPGRQTPYVMCAI